MTRKVSSNFFKTPLSSVDVIESIPARGEITLTELTAKLEVKIPPDCAIRRVIGAAPGVTRSLCEGTVEANVVAARGRRGLVQTKLVNLHRQGVIAARYYGGEMFVKRKRNKRKESHVKGEAKTRHHSD